MKKLIHYTKETIEFLKHNSNNVDKMFIICDEYSFDRIKLHIDEIPNTMFIIADPSGNKNMWSNDWIKLKNDSLYRYLSLGNIDWYFKEHRMMDVYDKYMDYNNIYFIFYDDVSYFISAAEMFCKVSNIKNGEVVEFSESNIEFTYFNNYFFSDKYGTEYRVDNLIRK